MMCDTYSVLWGGIVLAKGMSLDHAVLFVKALFSAFYNEPDLYYTIARESDTETEAGAAG